MKTTLLAMGLAVSTVALALAGCAPLNQSALSGSNPANPRAAEAPVPAAIPFLMAGTNYAMAPQPEAKEMPAHEHQH
jgi:hypothetical protein